MKKLGMNPRRQRAVSAILAAFICLAGYGMAFAGREEVRPEKYHSQVEKLVSRLLTKFHYSRLSLSDSLSSEIFDRYIDRLDYNRNYFLASDINDFETYRFQMDDFITRGDLNAVYDIFNRFKERVHIRMDRAEARIKQNFDFTIDEELYIGEDKQPWAKNEAELDERWRKRLKHQALNLKLAGKDKAGIQDVLSKRYINIERRIDQYDSEEVFELFMNAFAQSLDPHTNYFSPINSENFGIRMSLSFEGIGARLTTENEYTKVFKIIPGGPADLDKRLQPNDFIIGVDEHNDGQTVDVIGWKLDDVVKLIRGKKGSKVRLQIIPGGAVENGETRYITLTRDKVKLEERAAKSDTVILHRGGQKFTIGVIEIPTFYFDFEARARNEKDYKSTTRDVKKLIAELKAQNIDGLIIDLRGDGGGSLQEAINLTGLFIDKGPVVQVRQSNGYLEVEKDTGPGVMYDGPLMVMVDRFSASASEIFAAAIQDYGRGLIAGGQTFGKGTVQQLVALDRFLRARIASRDGGTVKFGRVKVTTAKFYRVTGGSTQHRGVLPDITFPLRFNSPEYGEGAQINALVWDHIQPTRFTKFADLSKYIPKLKLKHNRRIAANREFRFLKEDIEEANKSHARKTISLLEATRRKEREEADAKRLRRENERRVAMGLPPVSKDDVEKKKLELRDFILDEGSQILVDYIQISDHGVASASANRNFRIKQ